MRTIAAIAWLMLALHGAARSESAACRSLADCDAMIRSGPGPAAFERRGCLHLARRDLDKAMADFSAAIEADRARPFALYGRGMARLMSGDAAGQNEMEAAIMLRRDIADAFQSCGGN